MLLLKSNYKRVDYAVYVQYPPKGQKEPFIWFKSSPCRFSTVNFFAPHMRILYSYINPFRLEIPEIIKEIYTTYHIKGIENLNFLLAKEIQ